MSSKRVPDKITGPVPKKIQKLHSKSGLSTRIGSSQTSFTNGGISFSELPEKVLKKLMRLVSDLSFAPTASKFYIVYICSMLLTVFQIITAIGKRLPLVDRKNYRRVSRRCFFACCACERDEKLCMRSEDHPNTDYVLYVLSCSNRRWFHLEFCNLNFTCTPRWEQFWMTFGSRILSLKLETDRVAPLSKNFCLSIVEECSQLECLQIYVDELAQVRGLIDAAKELTEACFENQSRLTLEIILVRVDCAADLSIWRDLHDLLYNLFPNITNFPICRYDRRFEDAPFQEFERKSTFLNEVWLRRNEFDDVPLARDRMLELFDTHALTNAVTSISMSLLSIYAKTSTVSSNALNKITDLVISSDDENLFPSVSDGFKKLTEITYCESRSAHDDDIRVFYILMPHILRIPTLRRLRISLSENAVRWNREWIEKISVSNIESIHIVCKELVFESDICSRRCCPTVVSFTIDALDLPVSPENTIIRLLETFPKLKNLHLSSVNEDILEFICSTLKDIESLTIGKMLTKSFFERFEHVNLNLYKLKRLKRLEIPQNLIIRGNEFIDLKCLLVTGMHNVQREPSNLELYYGLSSSLEVAWFDRLILPAGFSDLIFMRDIVNEFLRHYPKLKILYLKCYDSVGQTHEADLTRREDIVPTFDLYPSLQIFVHNKIFVRSRTGPFLQLAEDVSDVMIHDLIPRSPLIVRPN